MRYAILAAAIVLVGCGGPGATGNQHYVGVGPVWTENEALPYAEAHCAQYGRTPRFSAKAGVRYIFDCMRGS